MHVGAPGAGVPRMRLQKGKANLFLEGNPIVFSNAAASIEDGPVTDQPVIVADWKGDPIAWGMYNQASLFRCRIMQTQREVREQPQLACNVAALVLHRVQAAKQLRASLGLPSSDTNVFRLVNGEGDRLSGLVVDVYADHLVVNASASWAETHKDTIASALQHHMQPASIAWHCDSAMLARDRGVEPAANGAPAHGVGEQDAATVGEPQPSSSVMVRENGVTFAVDLNSQKTGFYADQRDNRRYVWQLARDRAVLDLCCYTGGFAINAALHGAASVVGVDSSQSVIDLACSNAEHNGMQDRCTFVCAKAEDYLQQAAQEGQLYDLVILDPPKLAPTRKHLDNAKRKYASLNAAALRALRPGGLLMTCSCSGAVAQGPPGTLLDIVQQAAAKLGRRVTVLREAGAAPDHTLVPEFPHGRYLTNWLVQVSAG